MYIILPYRLIHFQRKIRWYHWSEINKNKKIEIEHFEYSSNWESGGDCNWAQLGTAGMWLNKYEKLVNYHNIIISIYNSISFHSDEGQKFKTLFISSYNFGRSLYRNFYFYWEHTVADHFYCGLRLMTSRHIDTCIGWLQMLLSKILNVAMQVSGSARSQILFDCFIPCHFWQWTTWQK